MSNKGSEWNKWDLHIHSPYTFLNKYSCTDDEFVNKLVEEKVACIGLTNYFKFDEREFSLKEKLEKEGLCVFLNLELRLDYQNKENDCLDLHVIFSNLVSRESIIKFLNNMTASVSGCNKKLIDLSDKNDFLKAVVNFDQLLICLNDESIGVNGKYLTGFLSRGKGNARTSTNYEKISKDANLLIHSSDNPENIQDDRKFWLAHKKPLLQNSDAHGLDSIGKKFTWIKANLTFEGLKQIIYEPEERVKIQREMPESEKLDNLIIKKVTFISSENRFTPKPIYLNKNLNVIIGGKSSGKSILLYEIAKTLYANTNDKVLRFKDVEDNSNEKDLYNLSEISKGKIDDKYDFCVELYSESRQNKSERVAQSSILPSIKYIPQNHLSNLVDKSRKNGATLKQLIRDLILEDPEYKSKYDDFVTQLKKNDEQRNQDIEFYVTLKNDLEKKDKELLTKGDTKALLEGILFNKKKIEGFNKDLSPEDQIKYKQLTETLSALQISENKIFTDYEKLDGFQVDLKRFLSEYHNKRKIILESLQNDVLKSDFTDRFQFVDSALENITEIGKLFPKDEYNQFIKGSIFEIELTKIRNKKEKVVKELQPFNERLENQRQVSALQKSIQDDEAKIASINQFRKEIETIKTSIVDQKAKIFHDFQLNYKLYESLIESLNPRIYDIQNETNKIEILPSIKYNYPKFRQLADNIFDGRGFNNNGFEYLYQYHDKKPKSALSEVDFTQIEMALKTIFDKIEKKQLLTKGGNSEKEALKKIFTDYFFDHWDVESQGDDIHKMSTGKASFVLLKLIIKLSKEPGPILIDQPEDNLDNRSVSKELVDFIKEKKRERQIILVTHNPNIVVNADAENIIVSNQKGQNDINSSSNFKFDYINGALENTFPKNTSTDLLESMGIREHIAEVVEGGKEAFKKRERKYGFN